MKAITYRALGAARDVLTLENVASPRPGSGEVLVDVHYSGVNPSDVKSRNTKVGVTKPLFPVTIPHSDGSGVISAVGEGVAQSRIGEHVWLWNGQWKRAFGTAAQQIALPADQAVPLPDGVDMTTGAVLGIPGLTACYCVFSGGEVAGKTVLVQGGAGTVGLLAVQLAKWGGARVIATASGIGIERARNAGADAVIDYHASDLSAQILAANDGALVDLIIEVEFGPNIAVDTEVIAENARIVAYGSAKEVMPTVPFVPLMYKAVTLKAALVYILTPKERVATIQKLTTALSDGALNCPIEQVFALPDCARAHEVVEAGGRTGAILIKMAD